MVGTAAAKEPDATRRYPKPDTRGPITQPEPPPFLTVHAVPPITLIGSRYTIDVGTAYDDTRFTPSSGVAGKLQLLRSLLRTHTWRVHVYCASTW